MRMGGAGLRGPTRDPFHPKEVRYQAVFLADRFSSPSPQSTSDGTTLRNHFAQQQSESHILGGDTEDLWCG
jgi:hypothetical protein